jgi:hypothetical protein
MSDFKWLESTLQDWVPYSVGVAPAGFIHSFKDDKYLGLVSKIMDVIKAAEDIDNRNLMSEAGWDEFEQLKSAMLALQAAKEEV